MTTKNHQAVVANAVFIARKSPKLYSAQCRVSLAQLLQEDVVEEEATGFIEIPWKLKDLRVNKISNFLGVDEGLCTDGRNIFYSF
jgi:hypothetical protein